MPVSPERKPGLPVEERAEEFEITPELKKTGIEGVETAIKARVKDKGKHLIQTPATRTVTIQLPADKATLSSWAKGSVSSSLTWFAAFWLRMIKKAMHYGLKIVVRKRRGQDAAGSD